jgi:hypothetical protein
MKVILGMARSTGGPRRSQAKPWETCHAAAGSVAQSSPALLRNYVERDSPISASVTNPPKLTFA